MIGLTLFVFVTGLILASPEVPRPFRLALAIFLLVLGGLLGALQYFRVPA